MSEPRGGFLARLDLSIDALFRVARSTQTPPRKRRIITALVLASIACVAPYIRYLGDPEHPTDFGQLWFSAQALLHGANPYALVGPGLVYEWRWRLFYPVTAMIPVIPFTLLPELAAAMLFVWISTALLAYGVTNDGWFRLAMFFTPAFAIGAGAAQWSPLLTASLCLPWIAVIYAAKPNIGLALAVAGSRELRSAALIGAVLLGLVSLALFPAWPFEWLRSIRLAPHIAPPLTRLGGIFILLALLKWRRRETWLIVALACVPQTTYWYEVLPLFLIPVSLTQIIVLAATCSAGALVEHIFLVNYDDVIYNRQVGALVVAFAYLPAVTLILRRPNERKPASQPGP